ncbi:phosphoribosyltransferase family protein [Geodermatophilus amargosae]|uniref:phosphoribosyltransferase family protein n=1 Tax=Geodermatophilus amargosae TaxID=1296565 RepID=UPI0034DF9014
MLTDALRTMPPTVEMLVLALHGGPVLLTRTERVSESGPRGRDRDLYDDLDQADMLMVPPPIYRDDKNPLLWQRSARPASLVFGNSAGAQASPPLNRSEAKLIRALVLAPDNSGAALAAFRVEKNALRELLGWKENTLAPALARLKKRDALRNGLSTAGRGRSEVWLDQRVVRADTLEVAAAMHTARLERNPQRKAYALFSAERAYYYAWRLTPPAVIDAAIHAPSAEKEDMELRRIVDNRWRIRQEYLNLLLEQGHYDRMITLYRLWQEYYENDLQYMRHPGANAHLPRDVFFGLPCRLRDERDRDTDAMEALGGLVLARHGRRTLQAAAAQTIQVDWSRADIQAILARVSGRPTPAADQESERLTQQFPTPQAEAEDLALSWEEIDALTRAVLNSLLTTATPGHPNYPEGAHPGHYHVVAALGRSGALLAAAVAEALECRYMGWIAISASRPPKAAVAPASVIRGVEFPLIRARRVVVVDGAVQTGETVIEAVDQVWKHYPDADITVATYVLNERGRQRVADSDVVAQREDEGRYLRWAAGVSVDPGTQNMRRILFPWKRYTAKN